MTRAIYSHFYNFSRTLEEHHRTQILAQPTLLGHHYSLWWGQPNTHPCTANSLTKASRFPHPHVSVPKSEQWNCGYPSLNNTWEGGGMNPYQFPLADLPSGASAASPSVVGSGRDELLAAACRVQTNGEWQQIWIRELLYQNLLERGQRRRCSWHARERGTSKTREERVDKRRVWDRLMLLILEISG